MAISDQERDQFIVEKLNEGESLDAIQKLLSSEFGINMTFMDLRLLVADLEVNWEAQDAERESEEENKKKAEEELADSGKTTVTLDKVVRPGSMKSGKVNFASGAKAEWYLDQFGRLGLQPEEGSEKPSEDDINEFQQELQRQLSESTGII